MGRTAQISTYISLVVGCQPVHQQASIRRAHPVSHHQHLVSASDKLRLQGWPVDAVPFECLSEAERSDIAGEGMFAADVGTVLRAVFLCSSGPWWTSAGS